MNVPALRLAAIEMRSDVFTALPLKEQRLVFLVTADEFTYKKGAEAE